MPTQPNRLRLRRPSHGAHPLARIPGLTTLGKADGDVAQPCAALKGDGASKLNIRRKETVCFPIGTSRSDICLSRNAFAWCDGLEAVRRYTPKARPFSGSQPAAAERETTGVAGQGLPSSHSTNALSPYWALWTARSSLSPPPLETVGCFTRKRSSLEGMIHNTLPLGQHIALLLEHSSRLLPHIRPMPRRVLVSCTVGLRKPHSGHPQPAQPHSAPTQVGARLQADMCISTLIGRMPFSVVGLDLGIVPTHR